MRQRRRAERGQFSQLRARTEPAISRREAEARQRQLLLVGAGFALAIIVGVLIYGWFTSTYQPPRKTVSTVLGVPVKLAELVPYTALDSVEQSGALQANASLNNLIRDRVIRHFAGELGLEVTEDEIDRNLVQRFEPVPPDATETRDQLSDEGRRLLGQTLDTFGVSESDYRLWLRGRLYIAELQDHFAQQLPAEADQVFVEWIVTATQFDAQAALERINNGEDFLAVATEVNQEAGLSEGGIVGWVPEGALIELDRILFDPELVLGNVHGPLTTSLGSVVLRVTSGPEPREISDTMQSLLVGNRTQEWLDEKLLTAGVSTPDITRSDVQWVIDQII